MTRKGIVFFDVCSDLVYYGWIPYITCISNTQCLWIYLQIHMSLGKTKHRCKQWMVTGFHSKEWYLPFHYNFQHVILVVLTIYSTMGIYMVEKNTHYGSFIFCVRLINIYYSTMASQSSTSQQKLWWFSSDKDCLVLQRDFNKKYLVVDVKQAAAARTVTITVAFSEVCTCMDF